MTACNPINYAPIGTAHGGIVFHYKQVSSVNGDLRTEFKAGCWRYKLTRHSIPGVNQVKVKVKRILFFENKYNFTMLPIVFYNAAITC